jgi:16S rRNA processing protein RimM
MSGASTDFLRIARVLKSYGTSGEILMGFREIGPEDLNHKEPVFIMFDGLPVPFFIESFQPKGSSKALIRLTGMKNLEDAEEIAGRDVFARRSAIDNIEDEDGAFTIDMLQGWTLLDVDGREIGTISDYEPIPGNPCLYIDTPDGSQVMVPLHDDLIVDIDEENQRISLQIPEGLI